MIEITLDSKNLVNALNNLKQKVENKAPLMKQIASIMHAAVEDNFDTEGRPKWTPLKPATIDRKKRNKQPENILKQTGALSSSITSYHDKNTAIVGSNLKYAAIHQFGGTINHPGGTKFFFDKNGKFTPLKSNAKRFMGKTKAHKINIPARPFLILDDRDEQEIMDKVEKYLNDD